MTAHSVPTSDSIDDINVSEVFNQKSSFIYNYYLNDERVSTHPFPTSNTTIGLDKTARYVKIDWNIPGFVNNDSVKQSPTIESADKAGKIMSEDNYFNANYLNHTFSNNAAIEQGAADLENFTRLSNFDTESMAKMAAFQLQNISSQANTASIGVLASISAAYNALSNFPETALGLNVYKTINGNSGFSDNNDLMRSITESLSLNIKLNNIVIPDIFSQPTGASKTPVEIAALNTAYEDTNLNFDDNKPIKVISLSTDVTANTAFGKSAKIIGYIVDKYSYENDEFSKKETFYLEGSQHTQLIDTKVSYGKTYVYVIKCIASFQLFVRVQATVKKATIYISSRGSSTVVETLEHVPPQEPTELSFNYNHRSKNLLISWKAMNSQRDIVQFQVFRRSSIKHPFELIAQYGFDNSLIDSSGQKYKTSEVVDANNYNNIRPELRYLVRQSKLSVNNHIDTDFTVDPETYTSSDYIYAVCSVDAHGMISNYSTQYSVNFDSYKNKLSVSTVCDSGCPKQYPNLKLKIDTFKDAINISGDNARNLSVYFSPEYLKLKDNKSKSYKVVEAKTKADENPYYLFQMINLDNQKMQTLKIIIEDPDGITA